MKIKTNALTEKGNIRPTVRTALIRELSNNRNLFEKAIQVDNRGQFFIEFEDESGTKLYLNFEVTLSTTSIADKPRKLRKVRPQLPIEFEER